MNVPRTHTHQVQVGTVPLGGGAALPLQTMLTRSTKEVQACLAQIDEVAAAGADLIRIAIESKADVAPFAEICSHSVLPVIADVHFDYTLAVKAAQRGAAKLRINPGNIGSWDRVDAVIDAAGEAGIPIRVGVNAGSLEESLAEDAALSLVEKMKRSAESYVAHFEARGFKDIVLSAKASEVPATIETYRALSKALPHIPLHLGVTEAGTAWQGTIRSSAGIGTLLAEGIGDTFRVSLTADPVEEIRVSRALLSALELNSRPEPTLVSCPTCSRCKVDLFGIAEQVEERLHAIDTSLKVAVMGCVVNGPGEARDADVGVACGKGTGAIFAKGQVLYTVTESEILDALFKEIAHAID